MGGVHLLDVNLLVALFDPAHVHHEPAHDWFADHRKHGFATCALTENGFVRVLSNPGYGGVPARPVDLLVLLRKFCAGGDHQFWADTVSLRDERLFDLAFIRGHRQLTDVYLLGLAKTMHGCLATFDRTIPLKAVAGATPGHLAVIAATDVGPGFSRA
jgi:toxin-antitoxin system PIN domain toxin